MKLIRNLLVIGVGLAALLGILMWMMGLFTHVRIEPKLEPEAPTVQEIRPTVTAKLTEMEQTAEAVGSIQSRSTTNISSNILATILTVAVRPGDKVNRGDLLITLDDRDLKARHEQARNGLEAARVAYEQAKRNRERFETLLKTNSITKNAYDDAVSVERIASAKVDQAQEQVRETEVMLSHAKIYSPVSGTVTDKYCDPGDTASPGKPLLTMYDPGNLRVEVGVREQLSGRLKMSDKVRVYIDAVNKEMQGIVEEIVPSADPASRSVTVKVAIPKEEGIYPGMFGRIRIPLDPVKYLVIPNQAVRKVGQLEMVTIQKEGKVVTRAVRTGRAWNGEVEVLSGLNEGDEVVLPAEKV